MENTRAVENFFGLFVGRLDTPKAWRGFAPPAAKRAEDAKTPTVGLGQRSPVNMSAGKIVD